MSRSANNGTCLLLYLRAYKDKEFTGLQNCSKDAGIPVQQQVLVEEFLVCLVYVYQ